LAGPSEMHFTSLSNSATVQHCGKQVSVAMKQHYLRRLQYAYTLQQWLTGTSLAGSQHSQLLVSCECGSRQISIVRSRNLATDGSDIRHWGYLVRPVVILQCVDWWMLKSLVLTSYKHSLNPIRLSAQQSCKYSDTGQPDPMYFDHFLILLTLNSNSIFFFFIS
jgi:hypothetical protein